MEEKLSAVAKTLKPSPIQQLSLLAQSCNAVNLAEGFPDFPAPSHIKDAAVYAINSDFNQYRHVQGICDHVAKIIKYMHGLDVEPLTDIAICCGQSEAFAATTFALLDKGDEVVLFDPSYETYETCIKLAGGVPVYVPLDPPCWTLDADKLMKSLTVKTKAIVLNSPHNPTGKVFTKDELETVAGACHTRDLLAITDELEKISSFAHVWICILSTFVCSLSGWRVGWAVASACIASAIRNIHIKLTDSAPAPFQEAALTALRSPLEYFELLRRDYESRRDYTVKLLSGVGFQVQFKPEGSFFLFVELPENCVVSDVEFVEELIKQAGVVAVPGCGFFHRNLYVDKLFPADYSYQKRYIRFAFCKSDATLAAAAQKIGELVKSLGLLKLFHSDRKMQ
ncbi:hypothetical protein RHMOL_Rhmol01G0382200 [Rhododendron molle]|uniref:Uncharacterized protein n=1 Tax=Rhododendron molle TaxID=49168 RepID=A0ACC0Q9R3_RHOML|nr:hypothetical protein RHMOL_Rhmol01G0382200 [Rhododendron molle]